MPRVLRAARLCALALLWTTPLAAQSPASADTLDLIEGDLIRVTSPVLDRPAVGDLLAVRADTLRFRRESDSTVVALPFSALERIELFAGPDRTRGIIVGALLGGLVGAGVGLLLESMTGEFVSPGVDIPKSAIAVAVAAPVGAVIGYRFAPEGWDEVWSVWRIAQDERRDERRPRRR